MPGEKPLTIAAYAAGAGLAAITLVYVFGPTFVLDGEAGSIVKPSGRRPVVGLVNPANDCFINSVLQALAGLPDLRKYLIRELHRRNLDGKDVYKVSSNQVEGKGKSADLKRWKLERLQFGIVTRALKDMLDKLNERPIYKKTISAQGFVLALEEAFRTRISRQQQDAQEFLQVVLERVCDEYHAGHKARRKARTLVVDMSGLRLLPEDAEDSTEEGFETNRTPAPLGVPTVKVTKDTDEDDDDSIEEGFPFEGTMEAQIECETCHFKPRPAVSTFVTLTLNVPQKSSTTLNQCFDGMLKEETIDDFKCDRCRLVQALDFKHRLLRRTQDPEVRDGLESDIKKIYNAIDEDPEKPPVGVELPELKLAPKRRIKSIYSAASHSTKNMAKVAFPETLPLGPLLSQKTYKLLGVVTHKGGHNSGHYETFRRQIATIPYSTPHTLGSSGVYSQRGSPYPSAAQSPTLSALKGEEGKRDSVESVIESVADSESQSAARMSPCTSSLSSRSSLSLTSSISRFRRKPPTSAPRSEVTSPTDSQPTAVTNSVRLSTAPSALGKVEEKTMEEFPKPKKKKLKKTDNKWWRISDDKVKDSRTSEVLGMQKEVYLLFYELVRDEG